MIGDRIADPGVEAAIGAARLRQRRRAVLELLDSPDSVKRAAISANDRRIERQRAVLDALPFGLDFLGERLGAEVVHQDLDARLVDIVAPAELIVGAQDRLDIAQHVALRQERLDGLGEERRAAEPAADHDLEAGLAGAVAMQPQRQIVDRAARRGRAPTRRPRS